MVRLILFALALTSLFTDHAVRAQTTSGDTSNASAGTNFGAGYKIIEHRREYDHNPPPPFGTGDGPIQMLQAYPVINSPLTPDAKAYNAEIAQMAQQWWLDGINGQIAPAILNTDISLDCEPIGLPLPILDDAPTETMLPGIISAVCGSYLYPHGAAHGSGVYWGFNWLVHARRRVTADDIFAPHTSWPKTLTALLNADRNANGPPAFPLAKLNVSDTSHWVVARNGLGFIDSYASFYGYVDGGCGAFALIPWSKLRPYLNPHGIVPKADWNATLPSTN